MAAQFSHSVSKWNHSASMSGSPPVDEVVGVRAVGIIPGDGEGPHVAAGFVFAESRLCKAWPWGW